MTYPFVDQAINQFFRACWDTPYQPGSPKAVGLLIESQLSYCTGLDGPRIEDGALPSEWLESCGVDLSYAGLKAACWADLDGAWRPDETAAGVADSM